MKKTYLQEFIENLVKSMLTVLKIIIMSKFFLKKCKVKHAHDCIILGNGPSLKGMIKQADEFLEGKDLYAVNFFCKTDLYSELEPKYYVIASETYWYNTINDKNREGRAVIFKELAEKTTWDMILLVPSFAKKFKEWKADLKSNKHIEIYYFNLAPVEGFRFLNHWFFKHNLGLPRPHNVLIPAIKLAIDAEYKNVYLFGADHSWLTDIYVADNNRVYLTQKHFYDEQTATPQVMHQGPTSNIRTLAQVLMKFVHTFNSHFALSQYAKSRKVKVLNATRNSFIDAYERVTLQ